MIRYILLIATFVAIIGCGSDPKPTAEDKHNEMMQYYMNVKTTAHSHDFNQPTQLPKLKMSDGNYYTRNDLIALRGWIKDPDAKSSKVYFSRYRSHQLKSKQDGNYKSGYAGYPYIQSAISWEAANKYFKPEMGKWFEAAKQLADCDYFGMDESIPIYQPSESIRRVVIDSKQPKLLYKLPKSNKDGDYYSRQDIIRLRRLIDDLDTYESKVYFSRYKSLQDQAKRGLPEFNGMGAADYGWIEKARPWSMYSSAGLSETEKWWFWAIMTTADRDYYGYDDQVYEGE